VAVAPERLNAMLTARVTGSGDVSYKGNPQHVDKSVLGSGDVRPR
jgi:hypothetical protein